MKKITTNFSFLLIMLLLLNSTVYAENKDTLKKEKLFKTKAVSEKDYKNPFQDMLTENGKEYKLQEVKYKVTKETLTAKVTKEVSSEVMEKGTQYTPEQIIVENGIEYKLLNSEEAEGELAHEVTQTVEGYTDYDYALTVRDVPQTKSVRFTNELTGESQDAECPLEAVQFHTVQTVTIPMTITFYGYDSKYFKIGNDLVEKNESQPPLKGYEYELLRMAGADSSSIITSITWNGESYQSNGQVCRNALANVQQDVKIYRATYRTRVTVPSIRGVFYKNTYEGLDPQGEKEFEVTATATYKEVAAEKNMLPVYIGIGFLVLVGLIILILYIISKKRKTEEKGE